jgi:hypothetical protein
MNAVSKGLSLGIYKSDEERGREAKMGGSQPYVELMGRRWAHSHNSVLSLSPSRMYSVCNIVTHDFDSTFLRRPLYRTKNDQWRALSNDKPIPPSAAFQYITRSFRQTTSFVIGALKLLADSYPSQELNEKAWALYTEFRPEVNEWGKRSEIRCSRILDLRKDMSSVPAVIHQDSVPRGSTGTSKKIKLLTVEEIESPTSTSGSAPRT